jgi:enediyne biosynthesis protein E4
VLSGCGAKAKPAEVEAEVAIRFTDVAPAAGLKFVHNTGASGQYWMPETMGSGVVWLDYNDDGHPDLYLVNGTDWPGHGEKQTPGALYRNNRDGTFTDVTQEAGLAESFYGMGAAVGDFDNDGHVDLYVTALGRNRLYRNNGDGTFTDVAASAGVADERWGASAAWLDYDNDGLLDLFVCNYVEWSPEEDIVCKILTEKTYCTPEPYKGVPNALYRNLGNGKFQDVSARAGVDKIGKSLGVTILDFNDDGLIDIMVANDTVANFLYKNLGDGTFVDIATTAGVDRGPDGRARGAMGIDAADFQGTGRDSLLIGNFSNESLTLYQNEGAEFFRDIAPQSGVAQVSKLSLTFGALLADLTNNGWPDVIAATGHVKPQINLIEEAVTYQQRPLVFANHGSANFEEIGAQLGADMNKTYVARGLAAADFDGDGDLDLVMTVNGGGVCLFRNDGPKGNAVRLRLEGTQSNRSAYGTRLIATIGGRKNSQLLRSGMSYCSQNESIAHFGVGGAEKLDALEIRWPSGRVDQFTDVPAGKLLHLKEGDGEYRTVRAFGTQLQAAR